MKPQLIHCSYHKCLTVYFRRVMSGVFNRTLRWSGGYRHYNSDIEAFYRTFDESRIASVNNRAIDLDRLGDFRLTRFIRDPRDLVVSGYFYHRRGAESWCTQADPTSADWAFANGKIPAGLATAGGTFQDYLQSLDEEEGLLAELEFRHHHFESMRAWPDDHPNIRLFRYEDMPGREVDVFSEIFRHYGLGPLARSLGRYFADRNSLARRQRIDPHIRNPKPGQWRAHFTPRIHAAFDESWGDLLDKYGYPRD